MFATGIQTQQLEEKTIVSVITLTFVFYMLGALYLVAPAVGWILLTLLIYKSLASKKTHNSGINVVILLWIIGMLLMLIVLVIGHLNANLHIGNIIKSSIGWAKGWALLAIFPLLGYYSNIRFEVICRAACLIGCQALIITPLLFLAYKLGLPQTLYVSPLKILGGSGAEFFTVILYEIDPGLGTPRWRYFAPWAPAVGFVANIYFICSVFEKNSRWRVLGMAGNLIMIVLAFSRIGLVTLIIIPLAVWGLSRLIRPWMLISLRAC